MTWPFVVIAVCTSCAGSLIVKKNNVSRPKKKLKNELTGGRLRKDVVFYLHERSVNKMCVFVSIYLKFNSTIDSQSFGVFGLRIVGKLVISVIFYH